MKYFYLALLLSLNSIYAQTPNKVEDKALLLNPAFLSAKKSFQNADYKSSLREFLEIDSLQPNNPLLHYFIGASYLNIPGIKNKSLSFLQMAADAYEGYNTSATLKIPVEVYFYLGQSQRQNYKLDDAILSFQKYEKQADGKGKFSQKISENAIKSCEIAKELIKQPVKVKITNLGKNVNSEYPDYSPVISADESVLIFTSRRPDGDITNVNENYEYYENIYISNKSGEEWTTPVSIGANINTFFHEASVSLSADGQHLYIYKEEHLYVCDLDGDVWSKPKRLNTPVNSKYWEPSASISADNNSLFFVSNRPGGLGQRDIYKSRRLPNGLWGKAENLGVTINSAYDEDGPFIHPDGKTLYFSTNAPKGMGGFDIFKTVYNDSTHTWSEPKNLGYPINSTDDDIFFIISASGKHAYYSSIQTNGYGEKDIYIIDLPQQESEEPSLVLMTGNITMEHNIKASIDVNIVVTNTANGELVGIFKPNSKTGKYLIILDPGKDYNLNFEAEDHMIFTEKISTKGVKTYKEIDLPIELKSFEIGANAILRNIFFDFNKDELRPESEIELNKLYVILSQNPNMEIEIGGHTDNKGNANTNQKLSENRARKVAEFLISKGINAGHLHPKGYGSSKPIGTNDTEEGRQENRRIDYTILKL
jgi:hypothetical protein